MKAIVDNNKCNGCGLCESNAPDVFELGPDGFAIVKVAVVPAGSEDAVKQAVEDCPEQAISVA